MAKDKEIQPGELSEDVQAAVAETVAAQKDKFDVELNGHTYEVNRKAVSGMRFRMAMQKGQDMVALEILLGPLGLSQFIMNEDDDPQAIMSLIDAIGQASGSGNS